MIDDTELQRLKGWIGRTETARDVVAPELVRRFRATLDEPAGEPEAGEPAPLALFWCLAPAVAPASALGPDGHPARGGFLPPVALPRRMWAGGEVETLAALRVGDAVERVSTIAAVEAKSGRTGQLCFVTVEHQYRTGRGVAVRERQDIVYREATSGAAPPSPSPADAPAIVRQAAFPTDTTLLFRYSALTFNGHRIHYDRDYARAEEGYPDLVVHGPLQATALMRLAAEMLGRPPARFGFRGLSPLFVGREATLNAAEGASGLELWVADADGRRTMAATAS